jgi:hypothetical protein
LAIRWAWDRSKAWLCRAKQLARRVSSSGVSSGSSIARARRSRRRRFRASMDDRMPGEAFDEKY